MESVRNLGLVLIAWLALAATAGPAAARELNVLMIAVDDLRPTFGCYGHPEVKTPHLDGLAASGTLFQRAYTQQAVCAPSRTCLLTGRRPDTTKVYDLQTHFRKVLPNVVTLPQHFKQHGYHTQAVGKIYHSSLDDPPSWSAKTFPSTNSPHPRGPDGIPKAAAAPLMPLERDAKTGVVLKYAATDRPKERGPAWAALDVADDQLGDGETAERAVALLHELKDRRFFLAVGFYKPHLPFVAPQKYFDLYPLDTIRTAKNPRPPQGVTEYSLTSFGELRSYAGIPQQGPIPESQARELIRAYHAATSYTDALIGRVLAELKRLGLDQNTIVVVWGDHGWKLGEHGGWSKHTNFELDVRSPLIVHVPGQAKPGTKTKALVEFVDVYPTLAELCGLPTPDGVEGTSFAPLLTDPDRPWKRAAFSQYPRGKVMGYTMRTDRYRYTEWRNEAGQAVARELYDHQTDPDENVNVAEHEANRSLVADLQRQLNDGWQQARP
jgi:iduronate 2-sulfatase